MQNVFDVFLIGIGEKIYFARSAATFQVPEVTSIYFSSDAISATAIAVQITFG